MQRCLNPNDLTYIIYAYMCREHADTLLVGASTADMANQTGAHWILNLLTIPKTRFPILPTFSLLASIADPPIQIRCGLRGCPQPSWHSDSGDKFSSVSDTVIIS